jgi:photosystem II stability/assembly factor-like uncharacterized protein
LASGLQSVRTIALDPTSPAILIAGGPGRRLVRSTNAGRTWTPTAAGISAKRVNALAISGSMAYAGTPIGVFSSADGGRSWRGPGVPGNNQIETLTIAPDDPAVVYAGSAGTTARGLYRSADGGLNWRRLTDALEDRDVFAVAVDPTDSATVYIGNGGSGVFKTTDAGTTWQPANVGLPRLRMKATTRSGDVTYVMMTPPITALAVDPTHPSRLYAATMGSGVFTSTNGGASWRALNTGLAVRDVRALAVDATGRMIYAGTNGGGVVALHLAP